MCCANSGLVTEDNPAIPGETITLFATGIGISLPRYIEHTGIAYDGPITDPVSFALMEGAATAAFPNATGWSARDTARRGVAEGVVLLDDHVVGR